MDVKVSVLLITYNHEKYIAQAIKSALNQITDFKYEILIGDDCSTDKTTEIVRTFSNANPEKIKLISSERNVGPLLNEKRLVDTSKGKYLAFLEGDDYWSDDKKLQKQYDFLESHPDYGLTHSDVDHYYENTGVVERSVNKTNGVSIPQGDIFLELLKPKALFIKTATSFFKKEIILKNFDYHKAIEQQWPTTDLALWLDIAYHSKIHYFNEVFATYRLLNESASRTLSPEKKYTFHIGLYKLKFHYLEKYNCNLETRSKIEEEKYRDLLRIAFNSNNRLLSDESIKYLKKRKLHISVKEQLMVLSTKNVFFRFIVSLLRK